MQIIEQSTSSSMLQRERRIAFSVTPAFVHLEAILVLSFLGVFSAELCESAEAQDALIDLLPLCVVGSIRCGSRIWPCTSIDLVRRSILTAGTLGPLSLSLAPNRILPRCQWHPLCDSAPPILQESLQCLWVLSQLPLAELFSLVDRFDIGHQQWRHCLLPLAHLGQVLPHLAFRQVWAGRDCVLQRPFERWKLRVAPSFNLIERNVIDRPSLRGTEVDGPRHVGTRQVAVK